MPAAKSADPAPTLTSLLEELRALARVLPGTEALVQVRAGRPAPERG